MCLIQLRFKTTCARLLANCIDLCLQTIKVDSTIPMKQQQVVVR